MVTVVCVTVVVVALITATTVRSALDSYRGGVRAEMAGVLNALPAIVAATLNPWVKAFMPQPEVEVEGRGSYDDLRNAFPDATPEALAEFRRLTDEDRAARGLRPRWADPTATDDDDDPDPIRLDKPLDNWEPLPPILATLSDSELTRMADAIDAEDFGAE